MTFKYSIGENSKLVDETIKKLNDENVVDRIWKKDYTVWSNDPTEISNRLGWLDSVDVTGKSVKEINKFVDEVKDAGYTHALLMGMGGSSLAPEVFRLTFGVKKGYLDLAVIDSTHPQVVMEYAKKFNPATTLYIVSTKSGGTVETFSFMKFFYNYALHILEKDEVGKHFVAITDPESGLQKVAEELNFRKIFLNDPNIGGRFSALSLFGIVPAALIGVDIEKFLSLAKEETLNCKNSGKEISKNISAVIGSIIGTLGKKGIDKLTYIISPKFSYAGAWIEQLIAESTGKVGKGILPVDLESVEAPEYYSNDRLFVYLKLKDDMTYNEKLNSLKLNGFPLIEIEAESIYDLGKQYFLWEFATAIAGWVMQIQPFDQPNVEQAKIVARQMMKEYEEKGKLPELKPLLQDKGITVFGDIKSNSIDKVLSTFLSDIKGGKNYVSIQAYLTPNKETTDALQKLRTSIQKKYKVATTLGFGPRFLHSTGQLHKGDAGNGYFIQFTSSIEEDLPIPENPGEESTSITFGILIKAQALGDRQALIDNKRKVLTIDLGRDVIDSLSILTL
ncbi:MAG TPA: glucose-6-phosphate isomerase [Ignavibacteriales bacterium]|nr:glucose-6-phosphate isomerase [Ignavibacteriales bacterium]